MGEPKPIEIREAGTPPQCPDHHGSPDLTCRACLIFAGLPAALSPPARDGLADAIMAYGAARAGQMTADPGGAQRDADARVDAAWALVLSLL